MRTMPREERMSFDVFLQRFRGGEEAAVERGPVLAAARTVVRRGPDKHGYYVVEFPDGSNVEWSAGGLESEEPFMDCAFHIRALSLNLVHFIFEIARAGDMVIIPVMEGSPIGLVTDQQAGELPQEMRQRLNLVRLRSADELGALLRGGIDGWTAYRDRVVRGSSIESDS